MCVCVYIIVNVGGSEERVVGSFSFNFGVIQHAGSYHIARKHPG